MASTSDATPGGYCPFTGTECQDGCHAWTGGRCEAFDMVSDGENPRDFYVRTIQELDDEIEGA